MRRYQRHELNSNLECPFHPKYKMFVNGCGGKGQKFVNACLSLLPSSKLFYGACSLHDVIYALVSVEPIEVIYPDGERFVLYDRLDCDDLWLREMLSLASELDWRWQRRLMRWAGRRNYSFVREKGEEFFEHKH